MDRLPYTQIRLQDQLFYLVPIDEIKLAESKLKVQGYNILWSYFYDVEELFCKLGLDEDVLISIRKMIDEARGKAYHERKEGFSNG